jgi:hypothetical protein
MIHGLQAGAAAADRQAHRSIEHAQALRPHYRRYGRKIRLDLEAEKFPDEVVDACEL